MRYHLKKGLVNRIFPSKEYLVNYCYQIEYPEWITLARELPDESQKVDTSLDLKNL